MINEIHKKGRLGIQAIRLIKKAQLNESYVK